jgi:uncharacterized protein YfiM (DUF2279 family)
MNTVHQKYLLTYLLIIFFTCFQLNVTAQKTHDSISLNRARLYGITIGGTVTYASAMTVLYQFWYADYPQSKFHFFDDSREWEQVDKVGHFFTSYYESVIGISMLKWTGASDNKANLYGSLWGILLQTPIEIFDGYSKNWGFSASDMAANIGGSLIAFGQQKLWNEQKIQLKFSFWPNSLANKRPDILGSTPLEELIKNYNAQTYWLSTGVRNIAPNASFIPKWLNIAVGYGANDMLGGFSNPIPYQDMKRYRQFYLTFDVNTLKMRGKHTFVNCLLTAVSFIKFPAPAVEFNTSNSQNIRLHWLYF